MKRRKWDSSQNLARPSASQTCRLTSPPSRQLVSTVQPLLSSVYTWETTTPPSQSWRERAEQAERWWRTFAGHLVFTCRSWGVQPHPPFSSAQFATNTTTRYSGTTLGKLHCPQHGTVVQDHPESPLQTPVWWSPFEPSSFVFFMGGIPEKMAFKSLITILNWCFVSFFSPSGCRHMCVCVWVWENVDVLEWLCLRDYENMCRSGWEAILTNGWWFVSLYWQNGENCPPQWVLAKLALFILNIYVCLYSSVQLEKCSKESVILTFIWVVMFF